MSNHTKGLWEARLSVNGYWFIDYEQGGEGYTLTKLDCNEEDSRLIASAPEMLDALRSLMEYVGGWDAAADHPCGKARDAIAKATGVQS
jgi:hypothetical protein